MSAAQSAASAPGASFTVVRIRHRALSSVTWEGSSDGPACGSSERGRASVSPVGGA